ncbi:MAG: hypothetical protein WCI77_06210 [Candidatus Omnitrophota bacterium]
MKKKSNYLIYAFFLCSLCYVYTAQPQNIDTAKPVTDSTSAKDEALRSKKTIEDAVVAMEYALVNAKFACPRYLLALSSYLHAKGKISDATSIAQSAKGLLELVEKELMKVKTEKDAYMVGIKDLGLKEDMLRYVRLLIQAADNQIRSYKSADTGAGNVAKKYLEDAARYNAIIEKLLREPLAANDDTMLRLSMGMCPRWLTTLSESLYADKLQLTKQASSKKGIVCGECTIAAQASTDISKVFGKEVTAGTNDTVLRDKYAAYITAMVNYAQGLVEAYKTGNESIAVDALKFQKEALAKEKEIADYLASKN